METEAKQKYDLLFQEHSLEKAAKDEAPCRCFMFTQGTVPQMFRRADLSRKQDHRKLLDSPTHHKVADTPDFIRHTSQHDLVAKQNENCFTISVRP